MSSNNKETRPDPSCRQIFNEQMPTLNSNRMSSRMQLCRNTVTQKQHITQYKNNTNKQLCKTILYKAIELHSCWRECIHWNDWNMAITWPGSLLNALIYWTLSVHTIHSRLQSLYKFVLTDWPIACTPTTPKWLQNYTIQYYTLRMHRVLPKIRIRAEHIPAS